jgi:hypothetical protein
MLNHLQNEHESPEFVATLEKIGLTTLVMVAQSKGMNNNSKHPVSSSGPVHVQCASRRGARRSTSSAKYYSSTVMNCTPPYLMN